MMNELLESDISMAFEKLAITPTDLNADVVMAVTPTDLNADVMSHFKQGTFEAINHLKEC